MASSSLWAGVAFGVEPVKSDLKRPPTDSSFWKDTWHRACRYPRTHHGEVPQASGSAKAKRKTNIQPWTTSGTTHLAHIGVGRIVPLLRSCEWRRTSKPGERQEEADGKCTRCSPKSLHNQPHRRAHDRPCNMPKDMRTAMFVLSPLAPLLMQNASAIFSKSAAV